MTDGSAKNSRRLILLLAVDLALAAVVAYLAIRPAPVVVVPGAQAERVVKPASPDDASISSFALLVATNLENFAHTTLDEQDRFVLAKVSPRFATELERVILERKALVKESKMSSQLAVEPASVAVRRSDQGFWEVQFQAVKQVFVADRLSWRDRFAYRVAVEAMAPTRSNPYGLGLAGISISKISKPGENDGKDR
jgi:hypothetical protein